MCGYIHIYLAVYSLENKDSFGLEENMKAVCGLGRIHYGNLRNA